MIYQASIVIASVLVSLTEAYPTGAANNASNPMDAFSSYCTSGNFRPNHGDNMPQHVPAPYVITVSSPSGTIYRPGQVVTITIEGKKSPALRKFKGFFIQGDATESSFAGDITCGNQGHKVQFCGRHGVTHNDGLPKDKVVCKWTPPDFQVGKVQFVATIVENFSTFWTGEKSTSTLSPDPTTMTYEQKAIQMREQMMRQFQQGGQGMMNMMRGQAGAAGNPWMDTFRNLFSGGAGGDATNNPFAALMANFGNSGNSDTSFGAMAGGAAGGQQNPFARLMQHAQQQQQQQQQQGASGGNNMWSMFGAGGGAGSESSNTNGVSGTSGRGGFDINGGLGMANLPQSFGQYFQQ